MTAKTPSPADRLLGATYFLGLAPLAGCWRSSSSSPFLRYHHGQAMAGFFLFLVFFLAACPYDTAECFFLIQFPDLAKQLINQWGSFLTYLDYVAWLPIIVLVALWITLLGLAL